MNKEETKNNIVLIGMPASGKSTVGVVLAKILGMDFVDTDLLIQKRAGKKLDEIIEERDLDAFLDYEEGTCLEINMDNAVIATGGSVVYRPAAMEHFRRIGTVIYLAVDYEELVKRLVDVKQRGVVLRPDQSVQDLFNERQPLYEKYADIKIQESPGGIEETVSKVIGALKAEGFAK